jgi:pimeloyl-ACP methyl ester carboxylesterase
MMMRSQTVRSLWMTAALLVVACSMGQKTEAQAAFLTTSQQGASSNRHQVVGGTTTTTTMEEERASASANHRRSNTPGSFFRPLQSKTKASFLAAPNTRASSKLWSSAAAANGNTDESSSSSSVDVDVVLFGVGDLRTNDHHGLYKALSSNSAGSTAGTNSGNSIILPVLLMSDDQLSSLPNAVAHTADTAALLAAAVQDLEQRLWQDYGLPLHVQLTGETSISQALTTLIAEYTSTSDIDTSASDSDTDTSDSGTRNIRVHVSDLGDADNAMGYGSLGALQKTSATDQITATESVDVPDQPVLLFGGAAANNMNMKVHTWNSHLRAEPWTVGHRLPDKYTEYEAVYALYNKPPLPPLVMPVGKVDERRVVKKKKLKLSSSSSNSDVILLTAQTIQDRIVKVLELDHARCEAEKNTGLFSTHWGGLDPASVGSLAVEATLRVFVEECGEQDIVWSQHEAYVTGKSRRNERSLEHATMRWQLAGEGKYATGHTTENWLAGESMTRYLAAPLLLGTISPAAVWYSSNFDTYRAFFVSPLQSMVEGQEWHRLLAARNMQSDPAYSGQGATTYRYWRWHGYLCRYAVTNLSETVPATDIDTDNHQEGIVLIHGFGASGTQWNKAMQELAKISPTASQGLAPDLIGFGQSEKPALSYTSYLWDSYSMDFCKEIAIGAHKWDSFSIGGNSIGGFTSISVAACDTAEIDSRTVSSSGAPGTGKCTGLVLMNSAGPLQSREEIEALQAKDPALQPQSVAQNTAMNTLPVCKPLARPLARVFGNGLLGVLRPRIQSICKNLYPTNPSAVDEVLCEGILRDSLDLGAINVMISGGKLPPPRTVNELLAADFGGVVSREGSITESTFDGPVLIPMGVLDPLNDAKDRAIRFGSLRKGISVDEFQAGHWYVNSNIRYERDK